MLSPGPTADSVLSSGVIPAAAVTEGVAVTTERDATTGVCPGGAADTVYCARVPRFSKEGTGTSKGPQGGEIASSS